MKSRQFTPAVAHTPSVLSPQVAALDAVLNSRVAASQTDAELVHWLTTKTHIKRRLATIPTHLVESEAVAAIALLKEAV